MSRTHCPDPVLGNRRAADAIDTLNVQRPVDLAEMTDPRAHTTTKPQIYGPYIFYDQMATPEYTELSWRNSTASAADGETRARFGPRNVEMLTSRSGSRSGNGFSSTP